MRTDVIHLQDRLSELKAEYHKKEDEIKAKKRRARQQRDETITEAKRVYQEIYEALKMELDEAGKEYEATKAEYNRAKAQHSEARRKKDQEVRLERQIAELQQHVDALELAMHEGKVGGLEYRKEFLKLEEMKDELRALCGEEQEHVVTKEDTLCEQLEAEINKQVDAVSAWNIDQKTAIKVGLLEDLTPKIGEGQDVAGLVAEAIEALLTY